jgi:hypothetical protein
MITPTVYWIGVSLVSGLFLVAAVWRKIHRGLYVLGIGAVLLAFRWPIVFSNVCLNVDEAATLAGADTLARFFKFWIYSDGVTHGPLNQYPLTLLALLGFPMDYTTARLFGLTMVWGALAGAYLMLLDAMDEIQARMAILPALAFFAFALDADFLHYSSEHVAMCLLSLGGYVYWHGLFTKKNRMVFFGALLLGSVPWAKMQGGPIAVLMSFGGILIMLFFHGASSAGEKKKMTLAWLAGSLVPTLVILLLVTCWGAWPDFASSLKLLTSYGGTVMFPDYQCPTPFHSFQRLFLAGSEQFRAYWMPALATAFLALPFFLKKRTIRISTTEDGGAMHPRFLPGAISMARQGAFFALALAMTFGALVSITAAGKAFSHYVLFAILPFCILAAVCFFGGLAPFLAKSEKEKAITILLFLCATIIPQFVVRGGLGTPYVPFKKEYTVMRTGPVAAVINTYSKAGDTFALWGWYDQLPAETRLPLATRVSNISASLVPACRGFVIERFVSDVTVRRPKFFVDAVGPGRDVLTDRQTDGHEVVLPLQQLIAANYTLLADTDGARVYVLREGMKN